ncbi:putative helicase mov-10-B.1 [Fopius arisanus]|uniref:RNA helicase n=3 Tax=Fopius arisanus TaxID=64838 RepID=A0A0C9QYW3_9HYME|nr:PREDICTED: putative helicase mov-10-B.1 [Fopius arisanus]XP_011306806.1 PREDICTED: putative helicase mov-10-B.1 [Fopius arisanus]XP_011306888.1 PREDICTED: putative helicase mov-10-B.1 [Fopius arisanus]XP_011306966.1 PREDICTED: putative helicase mov-10-B.1 [Fopius arisanus]
MDLKTTIAVLSRKDTIEKAQSWSNKTPVLPTELYIVLENGLKNSETYSKTCQQYLTVLKGLSSFRDIDRKIYWYLWKLMLYLEQYQGIVECKSYSLYGQKLQKSVIRRGEFVIYVPGLSEDRPSLRVRDKVDITPVNDMQQVVGEIQYVGRDYISVSVDNRLAQKFTPEQLYNISFRWSDWEMSNLNFVLDKMEQFNLMRMVFPIGREYNNQKIEKLSWVNKTIEDNPEQQQAIINILSKNSKPDPYILFGPPGTGKTSTLIEAILQIYKRDSSTRVLICTPSNSAADEIALKLLRHTPEVIPENALYRLYSASRSIDDVHDSIKGASNLASDEAVFLAKSVFLTKKIVIVTLSTAMRVYNYELKENHFSYLFIDEAGQASEPQTLIPLLTMCGNKVQLNDYIRGQVIIAGDPKQLGPCCHSRLAEPILSKSMLERLMSWGPYKHSETGYDPNYVTKLVKNYRCHPAILHIPNKLFYDGELVACGGSHTRRAADWFYLPKKNFPVIFHAVKGDEMREKYSPSVYNPAEVRIIVNYVKKLIGSNLGGRVVEKSEIGILTPYKLQKAKIVEALEANGIKDLPVGTVEIFQGQEKDIIIISTVRSVLYRGTGGKIHIGFLSNPKRFNVAVTRAKALLIVVGNPMILEHDDCWREFMQYCLENEAWYGPKHLLDRFVSHSEIVKLLSKKHHVTPRWDPNANLRVVEDATSARHYNFNDQERDERRRRIPVGWVENNSEDHSSEETAESQRSQDTLKSREELDYWPEFFDLEESDEEDNDCLEKEENYSSPKNEGNERASNESGGKFENDKIFEKLRKRMEALEISLSSSSNSLG